MSANRPTGGSALVVQRLAGVAFMAVLLGLVVLSIAFYQKAFTPVVTVTLQADRAGNQLTPPADVKVNGVIVGEVRSVEPGEDGALLELALQPEQAERLPVNVQARLLPKTLFGEKFVELVRPEAPAEQFLSEGDVIAQDQSETAREFATALDNLLPLLETLDPPTLSTTLNAVSSALRDRGDRIGGNLVLVRDWLVEFNPELETLRSANEGLVDFNDNLVVTADDLVKLLQELSVVNRNLVRDEAALERFLRDTTGVAGTIEDFVAENEQRFITLAAEGRGPLELFAAYSPLFPCLADGLALSEEFIGDSFGRLQPGLHITLEVTADQGGYQPNEDEPAFIETRGPDCFGLPAPDVPDRGFDFRDGAQRGGEEPPGRQQTYGNRRDAASPMGRAVFSDADLDRAAVNAVVAPVMGVSADRVPDVAHLLFAPVARGTAVGLSSAAPSRSAS
jgi:phospholipid/cholesterol/gamma-HCH transport system substrate-binding protein